MILVGNLSLCRIMIILGLKKSCIILKIHKTYDRGSPTEIFTQTVIFKSLQNLKKCTFRKKINRFLLVNLLTFHCVKLTFSWR